MSETLSIQEAARQSGLSAHTLRYYERIGLISPIERLENGHRRYSVDDLGWLDFLKRLRATGMPVAQMKQYANLQRRGDVTLEARLNLLKAHRANVAAQLAELQENLGVIDYKIDYYSGELARLQAQEEREETG